MSGWGLALFVSHLLIFKLPTFQSSLFKIKSNALSDVHLSFMAQYSKPRVGSLVARSRMVDRILASFAFGRIVQIILKPPLKLFI